MENILNWKMFCEKFTQTTADNYYNDLKNVFGEEMINNIIMGDQMAQNILSNELKYLISEDGNLYVVYGENEQYIIIAGVLHKNKKLSISDFKKYPVLIDDINKFIEDIILNAVENDKEIMLSPNDITEQIMNKRLINKAKQMGYEVDTNVFAQMEMPDGKTYKNMTIKIY